MFKLIKPGLIIFTLFFASCGSPFYNPAYINSAYLINKMEHRGTLNGFPAGLDHHRIVEDLYWQVGGLLISPTNPDKYASYVNEENEVFYILDEGIYNPMFFDISLGIETNSNGPTMILFPLSDPSLTMGKGYITMKNNIPYDPGPPIISTSMLPALGYTFSDRDYIAASVNYVWTWNSNLPNTNTWDGANPPPEGTPTDSYAIDDSVSNTIGVAEGYITFMGMNTTLYNSGSRSLQSIVRDSQNNIFYEINQLLPDGGHPHAITPQNATILNTMDSDIFIDLNYNPDELYQSYYAHDYIGQRSVASIITNNHGFKSYFWSTQGAGTSDSSDIIPISAPPRAHVAATLSTGDILFLSKERQEGSYQEVFVLSVLGKNNVLDRLNCGYLVYVSETIIDGVATCIFNMVIQEHDEYNDIRKMSVYTIPTEDLLKLF